VSNPEKGKYRYEVNTYGDPVDSWAGNAVRYDTADDAEAGAKDLFGRWTAVKFWRVVDDRDAVYATGP
jgi:hypothetical protein